MSVTIDTDLLHINIPILVDDIMSGRLLIGDALPKLDSIRGEEFRSMLIAEADLMKAQGDEADRLKIRMIEGRVAESLDRDECERGIEFATVRKGKSPAFSTYEGSKSAEIRGLSLSKASNVIKAGDTIAMEKALASLSKPEPQTPKTSPSSPGKSRSKPKKNSPPPLKFDMSPASNALSAKLTLSKASVAKEALARPVNDTHGQGDAPDTCETIRASSAPHVTNSKENSPRSTSQLNHTDLAAAEQIIEARAANSRSTVLHADFVPYLVKFKAPDGSYVVEERIRGAANETYHVLGKFVPMNVEEASDKSYSVRQRQVPNPSIAALGPSRDEVPVIDTEISLPIEPVTDLADSVEFESPENDIGVSLNLKPYAIPEFLMLFKGPAYSFRNLWIVVASIWALYSTWHRSDKILGALVAGIKAVKEGSLWVLDKLFGFVGVLVRDYLEWREDESGIIASAVFDG
ncbi:uncharacterized protein RCO7_08139 [Rhynchosporium graminicola]|uniref:Uncharacterized protein n=1 Tax=Rhynchosporium graminicola TaxID=2792576 RepID=A0A1E1LDF3_9HELO|nr:uncharacterized protein RCO7_08139 [Rhynchosporium commune]